MTPSRPSIPEGFCQCGCGQATDVYPYNNAAKGWIKGRHFKRVFGHGRRNFRPPVIQPDEYKIIRLTKDAVTLVSNFDFRSLSMGRWHLSNKGYAITTSWNGRRAYMHRVIMNAPKGLEVDHINGNPLDNRRENLRLCSHSQNGANKATKNISGYRGVYKVSKNRWHARIKINKRSVYLGSFDDPHNAALCFNEALLKKFGAFAQLNEVRREA